MDPRKAHNNPHTGHQSQRRGVSSFSRQDPERVFAALAIRPGDNILDLGCGSGDYSLRAARETGPGGRVLAFDRWPDPIAALNDKAKEAGLKNLKAKTADILAPLPLKADSVDVVILFTVLHGLGIQDEAPRLAAEILRVLKPKGRFGVLEMKKQETPFGPPLELRLSEDETEKIFCDCGFKPLSVIDLGHNYMSVFGKA